MKETGDRNLFETKKKSSNDGGLETQTNTQKIETQVG